MAINPKIKQKAEDIRKKIFGAEVRESLASGLEVMSEDVESIKGRQDNVENQFQDVLDETTEKDVISAPELIAARNGKSNLKTRLDDEHAQVTAQLQQTPYISIENFPRLPDETDDTLRFKRAAGEAIAQNKRLYCPNEYILTRLDIEIPEGKSFSVFGNGFNSILKRKDGFCTRNGDHMIRIYPTGNCDIVEFSNLKIDGNARNNPMPDGENPTTSYLWQHNASIRVEARKDSEIKLFRARELLIDDSVADGLHWAGLESCYVHDIVVNGIYTDIRTRTRSDLCLTGTCKSYTATNIRVKKFEVEMNRNYEEIDTCNLMFDNVVVDLFDVAGRNINVDMYANNIVTRFFSIWKLRHALIENSKMGMHNTNISEYFVSICNDVTFKNCIIDFKTYQGTDGFYINPIRITHNIDLEKSIYNFEDCDFIITDNRAPLYSGYAIERVVINNDEYLNIINCHFDEKFEANVKADRSRHVYLKDNNYSSSESTPPIYYSSAERNTSGTITNFTHLTIDGGNFDRVKSGRIIRTLELIGGFLKMRNISLDERLTTVASGGTFNPYNPTRLENRRIVYLESDMSNSRLYGFKGDIFRLKEPPENGVYERIGVRNRTGPSGPFIETKVLTTIS